MPLIGAGRKFPWREPLEAPPVLKDPASCFQRRTQQMLVEALLDIAQFAHKWVLRRQHGRWRWSNNGRSGRCHRPPSLLKRVLELPPREAFARRAAGAVLGGYPALAIKTWHRQTIGLERLFKPKSHDASVSRPDAPRSRGGSWSAGGAGQPCPRSDTLEQ